MEIHSSSYLFIIPAGAQVHIEPASGGSYGFALCDSNDNVIEYTTNAAKHTFEKQYTETHLWASAPKLGNTYYTITYKEPESNYWTGKTIWWCGTSIPAGGYPQIAGEMLGANVINTATGGSMCRANVRTGDYNGVNISNITSSLSMTLEEAESFISNYDAIRRLDRNGSLPATLESSYMKRIRQGSFEGNRLRIPDSCPEGLGCRLVLPVLRCSILSRHIPAYNSRHQQLLRRLCVPLRHKRLPYLLP